MTTTMARIATDPATGMAGDARITANLAAGRYIVALTQYDNFSIGNLADGFVETGHPNFTADPSFANGGACPGNMFRDTSGTDGRCRTGSWALDFVNVASVTPAAPVPEPSALFLLGLGLSALFLMRGKRQRRAKLLAGGVVMVIAAGSSSFAQTTTKNPDSSNVDDILQGNRTLLQTSDLQISYYINNDTIQLFPITTSNSQQTPVPPPPALGSGDSSKPLRTISAHMFNQTEAITITPVYNYQHSALLTLCLQNVASVASKSTIWQPLPAGNEPTINAMAVGDFNQDGYDDLALSDSNGGMLIVSPNDVNDGSKGFKKITANLSVLTAMAAGDFAGDGHQEIAGLVNGPNGGLTLVIYTVNASSMTMALASSIPLTTGGTAASPISLVSMARGRFNSISHDQLAVTFATSSGPSTVEIIDFTSGTLTPVEASSFVASNVTVPLGYIEIKTGKFGLPGNPYDQIVWHMSSSSDNGRFFEIISANPTDLKLTANPGVTYNGYGCAAGIAVGNFDHQQPDPLTPSKNERNPNDEVALLICDGQNDSYGHPEFALNIYSTPQDSFALTVLESGKVAPLPIQESAQYVFPRLVATDLQGRSSILGEPTKITINNTKPTIINAVPPMHADYITPVGGSKPKMLNISYIPDGFNSSYSLVQSSTAGANTSGKTSWSAGADESGSASFEIGDVDKGSGIQGSAAFHAAQDFTGSKENSNNNYAKSDFDITSVTKQGRHCFLR